MGIKQIIPAGFIDSDEEFDEFGDYIERKVYINEPQVEDFQLILQNACISNNVPEIIRALNSKSVNINSYLPDNWTPLMHAAFNGSLDAVTYLLQNGADPSVDYNLHNVIMCLCNCKYTSNKINLLNCLKLLMNVCSIDINAKDRAGTTALMYACSNGWLKLVEFLIEHGADVDIRDNQNCETALFYAVRCNNINIVKYLLTHGADKDIIDKKHQTVHRIAENKNRVEILKLLGINFNTKLDLYFTKECTYWDVVMTELKNGFNKDVQLFLEALSMEIYINNLNSNKITLKQLLSGDKDVYDKMGIALVPHRKLLNTALKCYHTWNWFNHSMGISKDDMNGEDIANILASVVRRLHIIDASLMYLENNSYSLNHQKSLEAMVFLNSIKATEDKIFQLLDKQTKTKKVDYIGPNVLKIPKNKISITDKLFVAAIVVLTIFQIV